MKLPPALTLLFASCCSNSPMFRPYATSLFGSMRNLIFLGGAAEAGHVDHVRHRLELLLQHPVLERLQFHQVVFGIGALQRVRKIWPTGL